MVEIPIVVVMTWALVEEVVPVMAHHNTGVILTCISCSLIMESPFRQGKRTFDSNCTILYKAIKINTVLQLLIFASLLLFKFFVSLLVGLATSMTLN